MNYGLNSLVQQIANYAYALLSTICMHIFRGSLVYIMQESNFVIHFSLYTKDHEVLTLPCATNVFFFGV